MMNRIFINSRFFHFLKEDDLVTSYINLDFSGVISEIVTV